jgi:hypothetical protein
MQENMHKALVMCATMEVSLLLLVLLELVGPQRSVSRVAGGLLRARSQALYRR